VVAELRGRVTPVCHTGMVLVDGAGVRRNDHWYELGRLPAVQVRSLAPVVGPKRMFVDLAKRVICSVRVTL